MTLVDAQRITVRFGGVTALRDVDLAVEAGQVHALLGENGAGKSTLMKVIAGAVRPDAGMLAVDGATVAFRSPRDAHAAGVRMVHQELRLVPAMSAVANVVLGREHRLDRRAARSVTVAALARLGPAASAIDVDRPVETLSLAQRQLVEIAKALATGFDAQAAAKLLILDEPTAVLSARECEVLFEIIDTLAAAGVGIIYTTHRLDEVERLAQTVTILRDGQRVAHGKAGEFPREVIIQHMVGRGGVATTPPAASSVGATTVLAVDRLRAPGVHDVSFRVQAGEIVGLVGLVGSGRSEVARAIVGAASIAGGEVVLRDERFRPRSPADAVRAGIGYIPEDRAASALNLIGSLRANLTLPSLHDLSRFGVVMVRAERELTEQWVERLAMRTSSIEAPVSRLSGGTQQKVVIARWLARRVTLLIADEPTRGVDVGARQEIYRALRAAAHDGAGVLVITSDLEEGLTLCDRLIVMRQGRAAGELAGADRTASRVGVLMMPAS